MDLSLMEIVTYGVSNRASDVHIGIGRRPKIRIDSRLIDAPFDEVTPEIMEHFLQEITPPDRLRAFHEFKEMDFSFSRESLGSFRVNLFVERGRPGIAIRILPEKIWTFDQCGLPGEILKNFAAAPHGLVLVTGATGSGKTTTLAAMVNHINETRPCHIITIEDPIEFVFTNKMAKVDQREVGQDTRSFSGALKYILRQDPDVVLVGEMRDIETIETALTVAETGHLVMATLHTSDAVQTINRVIDVFPEHKQQQVRVQLSFVLNAVISQRLIPSVKSGRNLASEIMVATAAVRAMIREGKGHQIYSLIQTGRNTGMKSMNQSLAELVLAGKVTLEEAIHYSTDVEELMSLTQNAFQGSMRKR